ncbi:Vitamin B6 transporter, variant 2 [Clarireedia jacksonii]
MSFRIRMSSAEQIASTHLEQDIEKGRNVKDVPGLDPSPIDRPNLKSSAHDATIPITSTPPRNRFFQKTERIERFLGIEARGIHRVLPEEQTPETTLTFLQIVVLWFSMNTAPQNITLASIGSSVYGLGFLDATMCSVFGAILGILPVAYVAGWGPWSGNRTLICARFSMGWWPVKICVILNLVIVLGYSMIDAVVAGQMLSAVSPNGSLSVEVGIVITAVLTFFITTLGIKIFHHYERYAWIPQTCVLFILAGTAGPKFDLYTKSTVEGSTLAGNRLSFFSICLSAAITYAPIAADFFVYCDPKIATRTKVFAATFLGLAFSFTFTFVIGAGLASGLANNALWEAAGAGTGALIVAGFDSLGGFGKFCSVVAALGLIANMIPTAYSCGIDIQILGRYPAMVPRFLWNTFGVIVFTVCALAGRNDLSEVFTNFLSLMGYWVVLWIVITLEEQLIFRRRKDPKFVWSNWDSSEKLPLGIAAFAAFCVGWVGAILCMSQYYFIGPLAKMVGSEGGDMGNYVGFAWAGLVYPPLRWWELKRFGR